LMLFFGLGLNTVVIGLFLYSLLPIIRNTFVGLKEVDKNYVEAGTGMGMTQFHILLRGKFALVFAFIIVGFRIVVVIGYRVHIIICYMTIPSRLSVTALELKRS